MELDSKQLMRTLFPSLPKTPPPILSPSAISPKKSKLLSQPEDAAWSYEKMEGNAWAQRKELEKQQQLRETALFAQPRVSLDETYKPAVPPKSRDGSPSTEMTLSMPKPPRQYQPVTPLVIQENLGRDRNGSSARAVTDPLVKHPSAMPEPLFHDDQARDSKQKGVKTKWSMKKSSKNRNNDNIPTSSEKAAKVLGGTPSPPKKPDAEKGSERGGRPTKSKRDDPPLSAPAYSDPPQSFGSLTDDSAADDRDVSPSRQVRSTPGPASKRFYLENMGPNTPTIVPTSFSIGPNGDNLTHDRKRVGEDANDGGHATPKARVQGMMLGDPSTSPTRQGTYGKVGEVQLHNVPSVASIRPVIEQASPNYLRYAPSTESFRSHLPSFGPPQILLPAVYQPGQQTALYPPGPYGYPSQQPYSPSIYSVPGAWDEMRNNFPNSMAPFQSPVEHRFSQGSGLQPAPLQVFHGERTPSAMTSESFPIMFQGRPGEMAPMDARPPPPLDYGLQGPNGSTTHGGPAPTPNHPDFRPVGRPNEIIPNQLTTMQFQIDYEFRKLTQHIVNAKDEMLDKVMRHIDVLDTRIVHGQTAVAELVQEVRGLSEFVATKGLTRSGTVQPVDQYQASGVGEKLQAIENRLNSLQVSVGGLEDDVKARNESSKAITGPCIVDGSGTRRQSHDEDAVAVTSTPPTAAVANVATPMAAYPNPAHNEGYAPPPVATIVAEYGSTLDPKAYVFTPTHANLNNNCVQASYTAVGQGYSDRWSSQDIRAPFAGNSNQNAHTPSRHSSNWNNSSNHQNQNRHNQNQDQHGYTSRGCNEGFRNDGSFYVPQPRGDHRNISTGTTIYNGDPNISGPDLRDHPAFAKSNPSMIPHHSNTFSRKAIPAVGSDTAQAHTVPDKHNNAGTENAHTPIWAGASQGWPGGNWYQQAYGQGQGQNNAQSQDQAGRQAGDHDASGDKRLYDWSAPGTVAYGSHSKDKEVSGQGQGHGRKHSGDTPGRNQNHPDGAHSRKESQGKSSGQNQGQGQRQDRGGRDHGEGRGRGGSNQNSPDKGKGEQSRRKSWKGGINKKGKGGDGNAGGGGGVSGGI
jgi:hypothetical protein